MNKNIQMIAERAGGDVIGHDLGPSMITESENGTKLVIPAIFIERFSNLLIEEAIAVLNKNPRVKIAGGPRLLKTHFQSVNKPNDLPPQETSSWG